MSVDPAAIVVVSGLPRSGTSLLMQVLQALGVPLLCDGLRQADTSNPRGYFEYEPVKHLRRDTSWLPLAAGKAVKIVSPLLPFLPRDLSYRVIFMHRPLAEIVASQMSMLRASDRHAPHADQQGQYERLYARHLEEVQTLLHSQPCFEQLALSHAELLKNPRAELARLPPFLGCSADLDLACQVIDSRLYRSRA